MAVDLAGAAIGYLAQLFASAGIDLVRGSSDERALRGVVGQAIEGVVMQADPGSQTALRRALRQCFASQTPRLRGLDPSISVGEGIRSAVVMTVGQLAQWVDNDTGRPFYEEVSVDAEWVAARVTTALITALRSYAAAGGLSQLVQGLDAADIMARLDELGFSIAALGDPVRNVADRVNGSSLQIGGHVHGDVNLFGTVESAAAATATLPADTAAFTGRQTELERVLRRLSNRSSTGGVVEISAIDGMAGVGKTAFAVHAAHDLTPYFPDAQLFLRLHGHTPGLQPVQPGDALASLLITVGVAAASIPADFEARARLWRDRMAGKKVLLILDDAISSDQVLPLLPGTAGALVLITSRRRLTALPNATSVPLDVLDSDEAAQLFVRLADRDDLRARDQGINEMTEFVGGSL